MTMTPVKSVVIESEGVIVITKAMAVDVVRATAVLDVAIVKI